MYFYILMFYNNKNNLLQVIYNAFNKGLASAEIFYIIYGLLQLNIKLKTRG